MSPNGMSQSPSSHRNSTLWRLTAVTRPTRRPPFTRLITAQQLGHGPPSWSGACHFFLGIRLPPLQIARLGRALANLYPRFHVSSILLQKTEHLLCRPRVYHIPLLRPAAPSDSHAVR